MGVYVKGMEVPTNCAQCACCDDDARFCHAAHKCIPMIGKPKFCPLVEVPTHGKCTETHGVCSDDLISRNAALALVVKAIHGTDSKEIKDYLFSGLRKELWALPSAEPKTGEWIEDAETFYKAVNEYGGGVNENTPYFTDDIACSKCLAKFSVIDNETERFDFCPNCGADMKGADDE